MSRFKWEETNKLAKYGYNCVVCIIMQDIYMQFLNILITLIIIKILLVRVLYIPF
jgi:hypothetical protein